jgi:hypothetical protein
MYGLQYGFELEGFYYNSAHEFTTPPREYPTDGFPGLVELRTTGAACLDRCYSEIIRQSLKTPSTNFETHVHSFSRDCRQEIRRRHFEKTEVSIQNLYNKKPRLLGNKTLASFQLNISNLLHPSFRNKEGELVAERYGLLDIPSIIRRLDAEFEEEIKMANRQPGEYAIKDGFRLEYRSLPNFVFPFSPSHAPRFLSRLERATKSDI